MHSDLLHCEDCAPPDPVAVRRRRDETRARADRIVVLAAHIHAATYRMLVLLHEFDEKQGWDGWKSCAQWLSWRTGIGLDAAREKVRVASALPALPRVSRAFERGKLSYSKVRALTRIATPPTEEILLDLAIHGTASQLERVVRSFRRADPERENARANHDHERRYLSTRHDDHGNLVIEGRLPAELGARVLAALDAAGDAEEEAGSGEAGAALGTGGDGGAVPRNGDCETSATCRRTYGQARTDALVRLADGALAAGLPGRRAADTHQIVVHVDVGVLADPSAEGRSELENGSGIAAETSRRLACDAAVVTVHEDEGGEPLSVGRSPVATTPVSWRRITSSIGPRGERRSSAISFTCAPSITGSCTRGSSASSGPRTGSWRSGTDTASWWGRRRRRRRRRRSRKSRDISRSIRGPSRRGAATLSTTGWPCPACSIWSDGT